MTHDVVQCVLLADRHHDLAEGVRGLLETAFGAVVMVANQTSMLESARLLQPKLAVVDLSLAPSGNLAWIRQLRFLCPQVKLILLSIFDETSVRRSAMQAGVDGFVVKRNIATDLMPAVDAVLAGSRFGLPVDPPS